MNEPAWLALTRQAEQLFNQNQFEQAAELARQALGDNAECVEALQVIALVACQQNRIDEAIELLRDVLKRRPDFPSSHTYLGMCYSNQGDLSRALEQYEKALLVQPDHPFARFNRALAWLKQGRYREGWCEYEWRWFTGSVSRPDLQVPRWDGSPLDGRGILVHSEQGMGDVFQFIRFLPLLQQQGGRVHLACQKPLHSVLRNIVGVDEWFPIGEPTQINFDLYSPLLSLPGLLNIHTEAEIPRSVPYLFADAERVKRWRPRIEALPGMKIGICWQGSPTFRHDVFRSISLEQFSALMDVDGISLVSLQKGDGSEQIEQNRERVQLIELEGLDEEAAFVDTAAVMESLDLVITSDTAIGHLAGALGRPVWLLASTACDWRWLLERDDSPWYPTLRIFRQETLEDWPNVFREVVTALRETISGKIIIPAPVEQEAIHVPIAPGELLDKISILEIKQKRINDESKRANVVRELKLLKEVRSKEIAVSSDLSRLASALKAVNEELWEIEDEIRLCEAGQDFGEKFIELARSVYRTNDRRAGLKREINELLGSVVLEEKSYVEYERGE